MYEDIKWTIFNKLLDNDEKDGQFWGVYYLELQDKGWNQSLTCGALCDTVEGLSYLLNGSCCVNILQVCE